MKKVFSLFLGMALILVFLSSCSNIFAQPPVTVTNSQEILNADQAFEEDIKDTTGTADINVEVLDTIIYNYPEYNGFYYAAARIKNTGTVAVEVSISGSSLDIEDSNGNFIVHIDTVKIAPNVIKPGEIGYISGSGLDNQVNPDKCNKLVVNLSYDSTTKISDTLEIEDVSYGKYSGYFYATPGRVINENSYDIKDVTPIVAIFDKNGAFLGVSINWKIDIAKTSKLGFSGESCDPIPLSAFTMDDIGSIEAIGSYIHEKG